MEPDPDGRTALHHIAARLIRESPLPPDRVQSDVESDADLAGRWLTLRRRFMAEGGSINAADKVGNTPLHTFLLWPDYAEIPSGFLPRPWRAIWSVSMSSSRPTAASIYMQSTTRARRRSTWSPAGGRCTGWNWAKGLDPLRGDARERSALDVASACDKKDTVAMLATR